MPFYFYELEAKTYNFVIYFQVLKKLTNLKVIIKTPFTTNYKCVHNNNVFM